jgi:hypothetical protein
LVTGPAASISQVPLHEVLPAAYGAAEDDLRRLAHKLDTHPSAMNRTAWHWYPENTAPPPIPSERRYLLLVDATITLFNTGLDWLELTLDIAWRPELTVTSAVEVACWCPQDHNMHQVRESHRQVPSCRDLVDAFAAGTAMLMDTLNSGFSDPRAWRARAALPDAPAAG